MAYADTTELFRILEIRAPSAAQEAAADRILEMAAGEIDSEIDLEAGASLEAWQYELVTHVNLQRGAELWNLQEVPLGLAGIGSEMGAAHLARNSWEKYAYMLAPLKGQWGIA